MDASVSASSAGMCVWRGPTPDDFKKFRRNPKGKVAANQAKRVFGYFPPVKSDSYSQGLASKKCHGWHAKAAVKAVRINRHIIKAEHIKQ